MSTYAHKIVPFLLHILIHDLQIKSKILEQFKYFFDRLDRIEETNKVVKKFKIKNLKTYPH